MLMAVLGTTKCVFVPLINLLAVDLQIGIPPIQKLGHKMTILLMIGWEYQGSTVNSPSLSRAVKKD